MASKKPQFILRAEKEIFEKISYIAKENERSANQEIIYLVKQRINSYEAMNGEIKLDSFDTETEEK